MRFERRGTILDIHTNDATLFNLGYTARLTTINQADLTVRKGSTAVNMFYSAVDSAKDASIRLSGQQIDNSSQILP
jgi:hypothetical protein